MKNSCKKASKTDGQTNRSATGERRIMADHSSKPTNSVLKHAFRLYGSDYLCNYNFFSIRPTLDHVILKGVGQMNQKAK